MKVFISYSHIFHEREFAKRLQIYLHEHGFDTWIDDEISLTAPNWEQVVLEALQECDYFIGILSPESIASKYVQAEWGWIVENKEDRLFLLWFPNVAQNKIPLSVYRRNRIDFRDGEAQGFSRLQIALVKLNLNLLNHPKQTDTSIATYLTNLEQEIKSHQAEYMVELFASLGKPTNSTLSEVQDYSSAEGILQLVRRYEQCVIVGDGGIGKTQTLYQLILKSISDRSISEDAAIPLFIRLSDWGTSNTSSIEDYIIEEWQSHKLNTYGNPLTLLSTGKIILFADGINEINAKNQTAQQEKLTSLFRWIDQKEGNPPRYVILTSRLGDYTDYKTTYAFSLPTIGIAPLTIEQIKIIAQNYFENVDGFTKALERVKFLELAQNPWFLSSLIELYQDDQHLPATQGQLFKILIEQRVAREVRKKNPFWKIFEPRLLELQTKYSALVYSKATGGSYRWGFSIPVSFSDEQIHPYLSKEDVKAAEAIGVVSITSVGFRFTHQRYAEYFAALYLSKHLDELANIIQKPYLHHYGWVKGESERSTQDWDQPVILLSGLTDDVERVIATIIEVDPWLAAMCIGSGSKVSFEIGQKVITALFQELKSNGENVYRASIHAFTQLGSDYIDSLCLAVRQEDSNIRRNAAIQALGLIGDCSAVDTLLAVLETIHSIKSKILIIEAVRKIGDQKAVSMFLRLIDEADNGYDSEKEDFYVQLAVTLGTWRINEAIDSLIRLNKKDKGSIATIQAIGMIGVVNETIKEFLLGELRYLHKSEVAAEALALLNITDAIEPLLEKLRHHAVEEHAAKAIHFLAFDSLEEFVAQNAISDDSRIRAYAAKLIGWTQEVHFLQILKQLLREDSVAEVRVVSIQAIKRFESQRAVQYIVERLFDKSSYVRRYAAEALNELNWTEYHRPSNEEQIRFLVSRALGDDWSYLRQKLDVRAIQPLRTLLDDDDGEFAYSVAISLEQLGWKALNKEEKAKFFSAKRDYAACIALGEAAIPAIVHRLRTRNYGKGIGETFFPLIKLNAAHEIGTFLDEALHDQETDNSFMFGLGSRLLYQWKCWLDNRETLENEQVAVLLPPILDSLLGLDKTAKERGAWLLSNYRDRFDPGVGGHLEYYFLQNSQKVLALIKSTDMNYLVKGWIIEKGGEKLVNAIIDVFEAAHLDEALKIECLYWLGYSPESIAIDTLKSQIKSVNRDIRGTTIQALSNHPSPEITLLFIEALDDQDIEIANKALQRLVWIGIDAVPLLRQELKNEHTKIRVGVISILGQIFQYIETDSSSFPGRRPPIL